MFAASADTTSPHDLAAASRRLRHAAHHGDHTTDLFDSLGALDESVLAVLREDSDAATAFWLNVYGALVDRARSGISRSRIAGVRLTADEVKHGILRAGRWRHGLGYLPDPFPGRFERRNRLRDLDPRVHFATLVATNVPGKAVAYTAANVDDELRCVTAAYLDGTVQYDEETDVAAVPRVFFWYRGDFGGKAGVRSLLADHEIVPPDATPRLTYVAPEPTPSSAHAERARGGAQ
jgi:hypothetical protein